MPSLATPHWLRRAAVRTALAVGVVVATIVVVPAQTTRPRARASGFQPNVIVFVTDDQTVGTWGAMPNTYRQIVQKGVEFRRGYVSNPLCCPSRAAILTGGYSHTTGVYSNRGNHGGFRAFYENGLESGTMASYLDATYQTALFGKYLNGYANYTADVLDVPGYVPPGWDEWQALYENNSKYYNYRLSVNGDLVKYENRPADFSTDVIGRRLRDWLDPSDGDGRDPSQPFFAYVAPASPHGPTLASSRYGDDERFLALPAYHSPAVDEADVRDKPTYIERLPRISDSGLRGLQIRWQHQFQSLYSFDRQIGRTMDSLRSQHLLANTLIIFLSDNGQTTGEHRWDYKLVPYERSVRVPFAIRYDRLGSGLVDDRNLVMNADVFSTVMDLTLGPTWVAPTPVDGLSLRGAISGTQTNPLRPSILLENRYYARNHHLSVPTYCGIRTPRWKYVVYSASAVDPTLVSGSEDHELYDLALDPFELRNVASKRPRVAARLRSKLAQLCVPTPPGWTVEW
jgi:N-acetylglucosamine-6-sulfatase